MPLTLFKIEPADFRDAGLCTVKTKLKLWIKDGNVESAYGGFFKEAEVVPAENDLVESGEGSFGL